MSSRRAGKPPQTGRKARGREGGGGPLRGPALLPAQGLQTRLLSATNRTETERERWAQDRCEDTFYPNRMPVCYNDGRSKCKPEVDVFGGSRSARDGSFSAVRPKQLATSYRPLLGAKPIPASSIFTDFYAAFQSCISFLPFYFVREESIFPLPHHPSYI